MLDVVRLWTLRARLSWRTLRASRRHPRLKALLWLRAHTTTASGSTAHPRRLLGLRTGRKWCAVRVGYWCCARTDTDRVMSLLLVLMVMQSGLCCA